MAGLKLKDVAKELNATVEASPDSLVSPVSGGYVGDLLSLVMAHAQPGSVWVTVQAHPNIVAVATLVGLSGIIVAEGTVIDPMTVRRATDEGVAILSTTKTAFAVVATLVRLGIGAE